MGRQVLGFTSKITVKQKLQLSKDLSHVHRYLREEQSRQKDVNIDSLIKYYFLAPYTFN
jgi:hypothetical protein